MRYCRRHFTHSTPRRCGARSSGNSSSLTFPCRRFPRIVIAGSAHHYEVSRRHGSRRRRSSGRILRGANRLRLRAPGKRRPRRFIVINSIRVSIWDNGIRRSSLLHQKDKDCLDSGDAQEDENVKISFSSSVQGESQHSTDALISTHSHSSEVSCMDRCTYFRSKRL